MKERIYQKAKDKIREGKNSKEQELEELLCELLEVEEKANSITLREREGIYKELFYSFRKLGILQELMEDPLVTEIMVNGPKQIFYEKQGQLFLWPYQFRDKEELENLIQKICGGGNRSVNEASPITDTRLADGSRVNIVLSCVSIDGDSICIRKFPSEPMRMKDLVNVEAITQEIVDFLEKLVQAGYNLFVSGGTGSGKTTFLNALSEFIPQEERVITIEDSAELSFSHTRNLVRLECRQPGFTGVKAITIRDLMKTALRMRPDRIIIGECRSSETLDFLQALNTGHKGGMGTGHGNSTKDMIYRLETMVLMGEEEVPLTAIRRQIYTGIDIFIHLGRLRDKSRKLLEIAEVERFEEGEIILRPLYAFEEECTVIEECGGQLREKIKGQWIKKNTLYHREKLSEAGLT